VATGQSKQFCLAFSAKQIDGPEPYRATADMFGSSPYPTFRRPHQIKHILIRVHLTSMQQGVLVMNCSQMFVVRIAGAIAIAFAIANTSSVALAHGAGGDIGLWSTTLPGGEKIDVGFAELDDDDIHHIFVDKEDHVFNHILLPRTPSAIPPIPWNYGTSEPGLDADEGELAPVQPLTMNVQQRQYWNGSGAVNFGSIPAGLNSGWAPQPTQTFADGGHHSHMVFGITGGGTPDGVYLTEVTTHINTMIDSDPFLMVSLVDQVLYTGDADQNADNAEALGELVRTYLADPVNNPEPVFLGKNFKFYADAIAYAESVAVPEPGVFGLAAIALLGTAARRRHR
jgi:hypothetical protein